MTNAIQVVIGVVGGILVGMLGILYRRGLHFWSSLRARKFWRPFLSGDVRIVVGRVNLPKNCNYKEPAGLVGTGDMHAATLIATHLGDLMVRQLGQKIEILDQYQLSGGQSSVNLICLGGPDVNIITRQLLHEINPSIKPISFINNDPNDLHFIDTLTGNVLPSDAQLSHSNDFGLLVKAPSPSNPSRAVMIIAGCFGYGTWAGAILVRSPRFLAEVRSRGLLAKGRNSSGGIVECFFESNVLGNAPEEPKIVLLQGPPPSRPDRPIAE